MATSVILCSSYDLSKELFIAFKVDVFQRKKCTVATDVVRTLLVPVVVVIILFIDMRLSTPLNYYKSVKDISHHVIGPSLSCRFSNHYENTPMQYTSLFHGCKNDNFQMNNCDENCDIFLFFAHNIDRGYTLEPLQ